MTTPANVQVLIAQRIDSRDKIRYIKNYLNELKTNPEVMPFFTINVDESGFIDYEYITRRRHSFNDIEKRLKENSYDNIKQVCQDLKHLVYNISDYLLLNDPLQEQCSRAIRMLHDFQNRFSEEFRENKPGKPERPKKQERKQKQKQKEKQKEKNNDIFQQLNRKSTFLQKIQMFYFLKAHQDNGEHIKSIGNMYGIGKETDDDQYVVRLDYSASVCPWLELLQKKNQ